MSVSLSLRCACAIAAVALAPMLHGCAVFMAAETEGVDIDDVIACQTRTCLVARGAEPMPAVQFDESNVAAFRVLRARGSSLRALGHGVMDVMTLGLWEVVGTPLEGQLNRKRYYGLKVAFAGDGESILRMQVAR